MGVVREQGGRIAAAAAALVAASALAACGGGGGDDAGDDRRQARATVERLYAALADYDAERACAELSEAAQEQLAAGGLGKESGDCVSGYQSFFDAAKKKGGLKLTLAAEVQRIELDGDRAVAKVRFGEQGPKGDVPLVREDGEWRLEAAGASPSR